ncbi:MAG: adenylosuccinate lyase family protein [Gammaproteobacteria bacterium]|nr:adenylosuccinate lyase family protein [Gammaproteobacteria bacterium]
MTLETTSLRVRDSGVRALFTQEARWQAWLDVEVALAFAEADLGMIPAAAAQEIKSKAKVELLDRDNLLEGLTRTGHQLVPLVWELSRICDGDAGNYVHWGATTQNIVDTGDILSLREVHKIFLGQLKRLLNAMAALARVSADYVLPGRTHGQHAVPATFGYKVAVWIDEITRHVERLQQVESRLFVAMLGGAAGTFASFGAQGFEVQAGLARYLDLTPMPVPSRTHGDHHAEYVCILGLMAATCGKIGHESFTMMKQEFGEMEEPVPAGTVGSSTMPQKRNPILAQDIMTASAQIRAVVPLALEAMMTEHEANRANAEMLRHAEKEACSMMGDLLERLIMIMEGAQLKPERMRANVDLSGGMILGEAIMLKLGEALGRQEAHDVVYDVAQAVATEGGVFGDRLAATPAVRERLSEAQIQDLLDPAAYTGLCAQMAHIQADRADEIAATLSA